MKPKGRGATSCCASPTGESPVQVSAGAPGSRPQAGGKIPLARAGRQEPLRREQGRGPQHQEKLAASTEKQCGCRAAHVTAKAKGLTQETGGERDSHPAGVWSAARVDGEERNTGGPSARLLSQRSRSYKPKAKLNGAQRESEGAVVLTIAVKNNAAGGKGPYFGHVRQEGKGEGMAGKTGPNNPGVHSHDVKARQPRSGLWAGAKLIVMRHDLTTTPQRRDTRRVVKADAGWLPVQAPSRRPSVSRVREIRMHGLNGGLTNSPARQEQVNK